MPGVPSPLAGRKEGEHSNAGGRLFEGAEREMAIQVLFFTRTGTDRILKYVYELTVK
jgi:tartrate dehydrogenase/decarboxylase/D-malate dehydrogenase